MRLYDALRTKIDMLFILYEKVYFSKLSFLKLEGTVCKISFNSHGETKDYVAYICTPIVQIYFLTYVQKSLGVL